MMHSSATHWRLAVGHMCADVTALLNPMPDPDDRGDESHANAVEATWQELEDMAKPCACPWSRRISAPVLSTLTSLRNWRLQLEADIRLLSLCPQWGKVSHPT